MPRKSPGKNTNRTPTEHLLHAVYHDVNGALKDYNLGSLDRMNSLRGYEPSIRREVDRSQAQYHWNQYVEKT